MKRVVDNSPAKRREMLWNSTVRGGVRSGDAPFLARFSDLCVVRGVAHSSRTRACVAEPRACRDVEIRFRLSPERPCILTASAGAWSATCRFRGASRRSQATRNAAQCSGEREYAIGDRQSAVGGRRSAVGAARRDCSAGGSVRRGVHVRFGRERASGANASARVDIRSPKRLATLCISTVSVSTDRPVSLFPQGFPAGRAFRGAHPLSHR